MPLVKPIKPQAPIIQEADDTVREYVIEHREIIVDGKVVLFPVKVYKPQIIVSDITAFTYPALVKLAQQGLLKTDGLNFEE